VVFVASAEIYARGTARAVPFWTSVSFSLTHRFVIVNSAPPWLLLPYTAGPHAEDGERSERPIHVTCPAVKCERAVVAYEHFDEYRCFCPECEHVWDALASDF